VILFKVRIEDLKDVGLGLCIVVEFG